MSEKQKPSGSPFQLEDSQYPIYILVQQNSNAVAHLLGYQRLELHF